MTRQEFTAYVESNQRAVRRFLTALCCGDTALADDLAQDTFLKAYLSCETFREDSRFETWIYRIAFNTFASHKRANRAAHDSLSAAENINSEFAADKTFDYQRLYIALEQLSAKERMALLLHYMQGYSVAEIAGIVDSTVDAVKQQLSRGRQHLKGLLTSS